MTLPFVSLLLNFFNSEAPVRRGVVSFLQKHKIPFGHHAHRTTDQVVIPVSEHSKYSSFPSYVPLGFLKIVRQYSSPQRYC